MAYLLDSDVFIQAHRMHYGFSICPAFWKWIDREHAASKVFSIEQVREELIGSGDQLSEWVHCRKPMFLDTEDAKAFESFKILSGWVEREYAPAAQEQFFACVDFYLVGFAHAHGHIVVTHEKYADGFAVKIPKACKAMGVPCINTFEMLNREKAKFVLGPQPRKSIKKDPTKDLGS